MPLIFRAVTDWQPPGPVAGDRIRFLSGLEAGRRSLAMLGIVPLEKLSSFDHAACAIVLLSRVTFAGDHPLSTWHDLIAHKPVAVVVPLKKADDLSHRSPAFPSFRFNVSMKSTIGLTWIQNFSRRSDGHCSIGPKFGSASIFSIGAFKLEYSSFSSTLA